MPVSVRQHSMIVVSMDNRAMSAYVLAHCHGCNWRTSGPVTYGTAQYLYDLAHADNETD